MKIAYIEDDHGQFTSATGYGNIVVAMHEVIDTLIEWFECNDIYTDDICELEIGVLKELKASCSCMDLDGEIANIQGFSILVKDEV